MKINCTYSRLVKLHEIIPNPKNTNKHTDQQIDLLAKIIDYQGWRHPLIISNLTGFLGAGHARLLAAKKNGYEEVPCDFQDFENEAQEYAFLESDNYIAELAEHDEAKFISNIKELNMDNDFNLDLFGVPELELKLIDYAQDIEEEDLNKDRTNSYALEVIFPSETEMMNVYNDLLSKSYIAKIKK